MKYSLLIIVITLCLSCNEVVTNKLESNDVIEKADAKNDGVLAQNNFTSYKETHALLQGSWSNMIEPESVIVFKDSTSSNMYRDIVASENVPYKIGVSCANQVSIIPSTAFKYITTYGTSQECYEIKTLDDKLLVLEYKKENITLTFNKLK